MKHIKDLGYFLIILFVMFPWIAGIADLIWIFFTSSQLTSIPWTADGSWRTVAALVWPIGCLGLLWC